MSVTWKASKGPSASSNTCCTVRLLDGTEVQLEIGKKTEGQVLFEQIIRRLEITRKEYFGLEFEDEHKCSQWLDLGKPVRKQIKRTPYRVNFKVRHYPMDPMVSRPSSRTQFYQQTRKDIIEGKLSCPDQTAPSLISYILQADLGDYESLDADIEYMSDERLVSNEDITLQEEISRSHRLLRGINPQESVTAFLRKVKEMDTYGTVFYSAKYKDAQCRVGVSPNGLSIFQSKRCISLYDWLKVVEISFKGKKLTVTLKDEEGIERQVLLERDSSKAAKELWAVCAEYADFYSISSHRAKEEVEGDLRSPRAVTPTKDIFGYPVDSLEEPNFEAKVKKSKSLPRKLPSDDPILTAAMVHRGNSHYRDDVPDSPCLGDNKLPPGNNMQLVLPDMPHIMNQQHHMSVHENDSQHRASHKHSEMNRHGDMGYHMHNSQHNELSWNDRGEGLKVGSPSRLSRSSYNSSQDMDGSLLDLADELGDGSVDELPPVEQPPEERANFNRSPQKVPALQNSQTLPKSYDSPKERHHSSAEGQLSSHKHDPAPHPHDPSRYKFEEQPSPCKHDHTSHQHDSSPYKPGSSHTTGREHKKKKDGKQLVRMWVQEQQLRKFQSSQNSQDSTSSSSIGANLDHLQPSPELQTTQPHPTPPFPLTSQQLHHPPPVHSPPASQPSHLPPLVHSPPASQPSHAPAQPTSFQQEQGPPKPPRTYYPTSSELYDHIGTHSHTLPSPGKARKKKADPSPITQTVLSKPKSSTKPYKSSEHIPRGYDTAADRGKQSSHVPNPLDEIDDLMKELNADAFFTQSSSLSKVGSSSHGSSPAEKPRRVSDSHIEQARHNRKAAERKLRKSEKAVNNLFMEDEEDTVRGRDEIGEKHQNVRKEGPALSFSHEHNRQRVPKESVASKKVARSSLDMNLAELTRVTSPTGGADLKDILQEVMESDSLPRPPAHLVALSQEIEQFSSSRSPEVSSPPSLTGHSMSPLLVATSSHSSASRGSSNQPNTDKLDRDGSEKRDSRDERTRLSSGTASLPPAIASFMSRVRNKTPEVSDGLNSQSDGLISPLSDFETRGSIGDTGRRGKISSTSTVESHEGVLPLSPVIVVPPTYDSPRLLRMEMSSISSAQSGSESKNDTLKNATPSYQQWMDDGRLETKTPGSDPSGTITTSSIGQAENPYDTPRAIHKPLQTNIVYPERDTRETIRSPPFPESDNSKKSVQRGASYDSSQQQLTPTYFNGPETKHISSSNSFRRSTEPTLTTVTHVSQKPLRSPTTPLTPMSQLTHSDIAPNTFTYPAPANVPPPTAQSNEAIHAGRSQPLPHFAGAQISQGYNPRSESGQDYQLNQANPRSRNYKPQSQGYAGGDVRRTQTFSSGRESGWSNRYQNDERQAKSPSDDSLPNSPTFFIHNNPNDDRDTPSPATQAQNASFQEHLKQLEGKGSRKMRVLDWMQSTSTDSKSKRKYQDAGGQDRAPMKKDFTTVVPSKPYQKQAPVYASIDDLDEGVAQSQRTNSRPGSGIRQMSSGSRPSSGRQDPRQKAVETHREQERLKQKLSSHSASGYDMEQRQRSMTRPYSRHGSEQRRVEMEPQAPRPASQIQRRAYTVSHPKSQFQPPPVSHGSSHDLHGPIRNSVAPSTGTTSNPGYPTTKYAGKDYYVIDV